MEDVNNHVHTYKPHHLFDEKDPVLNETFKTLLKQHNRDQSDAELVQHVRNIRDKAWEVVPYPCIGSYLFLEISMTSHVKYSEVLRRLKSGQSLLDIGSGFCQDLRKLAHDGAPSASLYTTDLQTQLWDIGYDLFSDKNDFSPTFVPGNFFEGNSPPGLELGSFDMIHASDFLHLFNYEQQIAALSRMLSLLKQKPGSLIFGRHIAVKEPIEMVLGQFNTVGGGQYLHTADSFMSLLEEVEAITGIRFSRSVEVYTLHSNKLEQARWNRRIRFSIELL